MIDFPIIIGILGWAGEILLLALICLIAWLFKGDFAITNKDGKTKFTFQNPSTHDIDFEKE